MVSLKKENVIGEITPVHLRSEEEAIKKNNTSEHTTAACGKAHTKKRKYDRDMRKVAEWTACAIPVVLLAFVVVFSIIALVYDYFPVEPTPDNLEIRTYERSGVHKFTILDEIKVNGSEKIYCISINSIGTVNLAESEFEKYLGNDANAVSVTEYEIRAVANGEWDKQGCYHGKRYVFPWSENVMPFSEDEKEYFAELICGGYKNGNDIMEKLSLDSYNFYN